MSNDKERKFKCIECGCEMEHNWYGGVCEDCYVYERDKKHDSEK
jgi:hypothetical protein